MIVMGTRLKGLSNSKTISPVRTQPKELKELLSRSAARWKNLDYSIYLHLVARPLALFLHFPHFSFVFGTRSVFGLHSTTYIRLPCKFFRLSTVRFSGHGFSCARFRGYDTYRNRILKRIMRQVMLLVIE